MDLLRRALPLLLVACSADVGDEAPWVAWDAIEGALRPEVVAPPVAATPGRSVRVVTFNVLLGEDVEALAGALEGLAADVVLVQEIESHPGEGRSRAAHLADALQMGYAYAPSRETDDGGSHGLAILSRFTLDGVEVMQLPASDLIVNPRRRIALAAETAGLRVVDVHLDTRLNAPERILQLRPAVRDAWPRIVVGGDFNMNPYVWAADTTPLLPTDAVADTDQAPLLDEYMGALGYDAPTAGFGATQDSGVVEVRLDAIYVRGVAAGAGGVARDVDLSDHWPLWLDLAL